MALKNASVQNNIRFSEETNAEIEVEQREGRFLPRALSSPMHNKSNHYLKYTTHHVPIKEFYWS
jgi:hypothetical protein